MRRGGEKAERREEKSSQQNTAVSCRRGNFVLLLEESPKHKITELETKGSLEHSDGQGCPL